MDFQSAARFGERRVMVTDYDETAVEVNAKVVDEDTGEVICESGGGGESDFTTARVIVSNDGDRNFIIRNLLYIESIDDSNILNMSNQEVIMPDTSKEYLIVLFKGESLGFGITDAENIRITGGVTYNEDEESYYVSEDATITASGIGNIN